MIGVFDSGVGGLTVLKSFLAELPEHDYIYLGDNARAPYGDKSQGVIYEYTKEAVDFLFARGVKLVIVACNTASAKALRRIQHEYLPGRYPGKNVLGVIRPLAEKAAQDGFKKIGVIGTRATVNSGVYEIEIKKFNSNIKVFQTAAPLVVPLIENDWLSYPETKMILERYLAPLKKEKIEALIPGCTHYQFLLKEIKEVMGAGCEVYNPGKIIAASLKDYLARHPELEFSSGSKREFCTTDDPGDFKQLGEKFLGLKIENINKVKL